MAGDWIKFEENTPDKPEIYGMAAELGIDPDAVVGKLMRVWSWASRNCPVSGRTDVRAIPAIDRVANVTGFAKAMQSAGWLMVDCESVTFPNFDRHCSQTAKERALDQKRKRESRRNSSAACPDDSRTKPGPEKRREEKSSNTSPLTPLQGDGATEPTEPTLPGIEAGSQTPPNQLTSDDTAKLPPDAPSPLCTPRFSVAWADWIAYRRERKLPAWKPVTIRAKLIELAGYGEPGAVESIRQSIANGYQGLFPPKSRPGSSPAPHDPLRGPDGPHADLYRRF